MSELTMARMEYAKRVAPFVSTSWLAKTILDLSEDEYQALRRKVIYETLYEESAVDLLGALAERKS